MGPDDARPYLYSEGKEHAGIMVDIVREISALIERPIKMQLLDFREARRMVLDGEADAVMPLSLSPERMQQFNFPTPLFDLTFTVFARENEVHPAEWPNLEGVRIGVFGKGVSKGLAYKWFPKADTVTVQGSAAAMTLVQQSTIDAMITTRRTGNQAIYQNKITNVAALPISLSSTPAGFALNKENAALFETLNKAIAQLQKEGTILQIFNKWETTRILLFTKGDVGMIAGLTAGVVSLLFLVFGLFYIQQENTSEKKLTESEERQRTTLNSIGEAVISTDIFGKVSHINPIAENLTGWKSAEAISRPLKEIFNVVQASTREPALSPVDKVLENGIVVGMTHQTILLSKGGDEYQIADSAAPILSDSGEITGVVLVFRDVTEEYAIQEDLRNALVNAERASEAKSEFLASMSHELRTPLNAVLGFSQMLQLDAKHPLTQGQNKHVESIMEGGNLLLDLVNEILDLARIEADRFDLFIEDISANDVVANCVNMLDPIDNGKHVKIIDQFSDGPVVRLQTDNTRLKQVLINLLSNAVKFNNERGTVTIEGQTTDDQFLRISVTDTGVGIAAEDSESIFNVFHRLGSNPLIAQEGTGIGLTVAQLLLERMAGCIGFESKKDVGSTFWIELPLASNEDVLIWTDSMRVGVDAIDKDHQVLISLLNKVRSNTVKADEIDMVVEELINYTQYHFKREEAVMKSCLYPAFEQHQNIHLSIAAKVKDLAAQWRNDHDHDPTILKHLHKFLRDWFFDHILSEDTKILQYTKGKTDAVEKAVEQAR
ncbi:MAG: bacteriohemerythrin [Rhodospirillaceae bacterium]|nr:bacteriohemerythrin [Rhodospirillaceae bacterium]